jgi:Transaldolase
VDPKSNLYVKIPATKPGLGAIEECVAHGKNINVTLIFSLQRYREVVEAYLRGLERLVARGGDPKAVHSVASFFVSRVDSEADGGSTRSARRMRLAARQARDRKREARLCAFQQAFSGERWAFLEGKGANVQRPLWASTSTKNPGYRDVMYVEELIGPNTVNTMPEETIRAFQDHGEVRGDTVTEGRRQGADGAREARRGRRRLRRRHRDPRARRASRKFAYSFEELLEGVRAKRGQLAAA